MGAGCRPYAYDFVLSRFVDAPAREGSMKSYMPSSPNSVGARLPCREGGTRRSKLSPELDVLLCDNDEFLRVLWRRLIVYCCSSRATRSFRVEGGSFVLYRVGAAFSRSAAADACAMEMTGAADELNLCRNERAAPSPYLQNLTRFIHVSSPLFKDSEA